MEKRLIHHRSLLQMFKDVGYEELIRTGAATAGDPAASRPGPSHQPPGTRSQIVPYYFEGARIAVCHCYLLPGGSLGASGKPDPKALFYRGRHFYCHSQPCDCDTCQSDPLDWRLALD